MKSISLALILLISISIHLNAQQIYPCKEPQVSDMERFYNRTGVIAQKEFLPLGVVGKTGFEIVIYTDLRNGQKVWGIKIYNTVKGDENLLDADEVDSLITAMKIMKEKVAAKGPGHYAEIRFSSRSGFLCYAWTNKEKWTTSFQFNMLPYGGKYNFYYEELDKMRELLIAAKARF